MNLPEIRLPERYNYIACFLTLDCNLECGYCINSFGGGPRREAAVMPGERIVQGLNRLVCPEDLPVTIQGGEPGLHPDFIRIIKGIKKELSMDILTNLFFDADEFIDNIEASRLNRGALYPNIRVSYHPDHMDLDILVKKVLKIKQAGFSIGIFGILHPLFEGKVFAAKKRCDSLGIDFRTKEFLGEFGGRMHVTYLYPEAVGAKSRKSCLCRTSELIIGPDGSIYRCHHDLYKHFPPIGNLLDPRFGIEDKFMACDQFGDCNPCDIKVKTNRFQVYGHTSVEAKDIRG